MGQTNADLQNDDRIQSRHGVAALTRRAYRGQDLTPVAARISSTLVGSGADAAAMMDLSVIAQLQGNLSTGLGYQSSALDHCQLFETITKIPHDLDVLILAAPIHMGGNTPVDFLLAGSKIRQTTLFVTPGAPLPAPLPAHDVTFVAAPGDSNATRRFLDEIEHDIADWPTPVLNHPARIADLERDQLCHTFAAHDDVLIPVTMRCSRQCLGAAAQGPQAFNDALPQLDWPIVIRPVGSHAGSNLAKLTSPDELISYLATCPGDDFFLTDFIDYRSSDDQFRKYRIVFVDGTPFPCHMAIADQWSVWYLNADMQQDPAKRLEEQQFMDGFAGEFARRHDTALSAIASNINLDYFGIDCAEHRDGRLVVFEADNALIVHDMDPPEIFPYKLAHMYNIFTAFEKMLYASSAQSSSPSL